MCQLIGACQSCSTKGVNIYVYDNHRHITHAGISGFEIVLHGVILPRTTIIIILLLLVCVLVWFMAYLWVIYS